MGAPVKRLFVLTLLPALVLAGCTTHAPSHATLGVYRGKGGVEVQLDHGGKGSFLDMPANAVLGKRGPVSGPIEWSSNNRTDGALDMRFYGAAGIQPNEYTDFGMSAVYRVDERPQIQFTIGDPDEGHKLVLTLEEK